MFVPHSGQNFDSDGMRLLHFGQIASIVGVGVGLGGVTIRGRLTVLGFVLITVRTCFSMGDAAKPAMNTINPKPISPSPIICGEKNPIPPASNPPYDPHITPMKERNNKPTTIRITPTMTTPLLNESLPMIVFHTSTF